MLGWNHIGGSPLEMGKPRPRSEATTPPIRADREVEAHQNNRRDDDLEPQGGIGGKRDGLDHRRATESFSGTRLTVPRVERVSVTIVERIPCQRGNPVEDHLATSE
jgi:hypothetical protein